MDYFTSFPSLLLVRLLFISDLSQWFPSRAKKVSAMCRKGRKVKSDGVRIL
jgi:hypothetical protein